MSAGKLNGRALRTSKSSLDLLMRGLRSMGKTMRLSWTPSRMSSPGNRFSISLKNELMPDDSDQDTRLVLLSALLVLKHLLPEKTLIQLELNESFESARSCKVLAGPE